MLPRKVADVALIKSRTCFSEVEGKVKKIHEKILWNLESLYDIHIRFLKIPLVHDGMSRLMNAGLRLVFCITETAVWNRFTRSSCYGPR